MSSEDNVSETNAGVRKKGEIEDVAEFAREVEEMMKESQLEQDTLEEFEEWRPRENDSHKNIKDKTVDQASLNKTNLEETEGVVKDLNNAKKNFDEAGKKIKEKKAPEKEIKEASKEVSKPFLSRLIKYSRYLEKEVYSKIMLRFNPYYFDSKEVSADLREKKNGQYNMDVNTTDKEFRNNLHARFLQGN